MSHASTPPSCCPPAFRDMFVYAVVAMQQDRGIALDTRLPWPPLRRDFVHYTSLMKALPGYIHENEFYTKNIVSGSNHDNDTTITTNNNNSSNNNNNNTINNGNKKPTMGGSSFMFDGATEERMTKSIEKLTHTLTTFYNTFNKSLSEVTNNKNNNDEKKNRNNDTKESNEESEGFEVCRNAGGDRRLVSVVIVGRKTWECMGEEKEYDEVVFVILTSREKVEGTNNHKLVVAKSFEEAIHLSYELYKKGLIGRVCVLGGRAIYQAAVESGLCTRLYVTRVHSHMPSNVTMPPFEHRYKLDRTTVHGEERGEVVVESGVSYHFEEYTPIIK